MFKGHEITRRRLLASTPALIAITTMPTAANALETDAPGVTRAFDLQGWLDEQTPAQRANYHQTQLAMAMCELNPGKWRTEVTAEQDFVLVVRDAENAAGSASVFVQYLY
jgi:hypothetical protein